MQEGKKLFSVYPRKRKGKKKPIYYVRFRKQDGGWTAGRSTGQTSRGAAEAWAQKQVALGQVVERKGVTLAEYAKDFYREGGRWATDRKLSGKRISSRACIEYQRLVDGRILPVIGKLKLTDIDRATVKQFRRTLATENGLANRSINKIPSCLKMILEYAEEDKLIPAVPRIERAADTGETRGILTPEEVKTLFHQGTWEDVRAYTANFLAAATGLRMSEILGLKRKHVKEGYIEVVAGWNQLLRTLNPTTKTKRPRYVPIPQVVQEKLQELMELSPWKEPEDFVFFTPNSRERPMESIIAQRGLYRALESIGISEHSRKERRIVFHSWRHWLNSQLINKRVPLHTVMSITGHLTQEMTNHYYHTDLRQLLEVAKIQEELISAGASPPEGGAVQ